MNLLSELFNNSIERIRKADQREISELYDDVKIENPKPHLYPDGELPKPEVKS